MQQLFDIKKTQLEMVRDRGYDISPEEAILTMTKEQFENYVSEIVTQRRTSPRAALTRSYLSVAEVNGVKNTMLVYYGGKTNPQQKQVSADIVREFIRFVQQYRISEAVLIVDAPLSSTGKADLDALTHARWQVFFDSELTYNPIQHIDVPKHVLLTPEEAEAKKAEMKATNTQLPIMKLERPIARYYGWPVGSLVRIERDDSAVGILAPKSINYRIIVG